MQLNVISYKNILVYNTHILPIIYGIYTNHNALTALSILHVCTFTLYITNHRFMYPLHINVNNIVNQLVSIIYFIYGYNHITNPFMRILGYVNSICMISSYSIYCILHNYHSQFCVFFYMLFCIFSACGKIIVLYH